MIDFSTYPPLCGPDALENFPGGPYSAADIASAGEIIRSICGWHIAPRQTETLTIDSDGSNLITLPSLAVANVTECRDSAGEVIEGWEFTSIGQIERECGHRWPKGFRAVEVDLTHGLTMPPADLLAVLADVSRSVAAAAEVAEKMGPFEFGGGSAGSGGSGTTLPLSAQTLLARYRIDY